ncbi:MAG: aminoacyl-histidine dipeptidase [Prolixibacteraceae bacterium]|jgi:dipeptidase D|nr:aminoacyl-histidine dipeptidase [Prolixibacteraceae bacterium]
MNNLKDLNPSSIWRYFNEICQVPRPSKHEGKITEYLENFAKSHQLEVRKDRVGNLVIRKPGTLGLEHGQIVVLQSHMDMVCEKNGGITHDFFKDPIVPLIENGWVRARNTTLGADCGIGMAATLAILADNSLAHPPIEALFTVDEETGLTGANALQPGMLEGKILLNLDSEDEGELFIGCAGGIDSVGAFKYRTEAVPPHFVAFKISVTGLLGGHSGDDIEKGRGNAIKILNRFLYQLDKSCEYGIGQFDGGHLRNAIPREANVIVVVPQDKKEHLAIEINHFRVEMENELMGKEPKFKLVLESTDLPDFILSKESQAKFVNLLYALPHGVYTMSARMPGLVETSTNLASVKFKDDSMIEIVTSQRSDQESGKQDIYQMVESVFLLAGVAVKHGEGYCGWTPNPSSATLDISRKCYEGLFGIKPVVRTIHAGLECGLFLEKFPDLDMISFGPTLKGVHSPDEKIEIASVEKFWKFLTVLLPKLAWAR